MTKAQRRERDFWLGCAEAADRQERGVGDYNLCNQVWAADAGLIKAREELLALFTPTRDSLFWWDYVWGCGDCADTRYTGAGPAEGRVLAACFLAVMAELGD